MGLAGSGSGGGGGHISKSAMIILMVYYNYKTSLVLLHLPSSQFSPTGCELPEARGITAVYIRLEMKARGRKLTASSQPGTLSNCRLSNY